MSNDLVLVMQDSNVEVSGVESAISKFGEYYQKAKELAAEPKIEVTDETQIDLMKAARERRLKFQKIRTTVDGIRIELKEKSLREGKAIDGAANIIKALIVPKEEQLKEQEKFAERMQFERFQRILAERKEQLAKYVADASEYPLREMSDKAFEELLANSKAAYEAKIAAEVAAEEERQHQIHRQNVFNDRKMQLLPYSKFIDVSKLTFDTTNSEFNNWLKEGIDKQKAADEAEEKVRLENERLKKEADEKALKDAEEREAQQKEIAEANRLKLEAENKLKEQQRLEEQKKIDEEKRIADQKRLEEESQRKLLLAPDKEKIVQLMNTIHQLKLPNVQSNQAGQVVRVVNNMLLNIVEYLEEESKKL